MITLPADYDPIYRQLLTDVALAAWDPAMPVTPFWPIAGHNYNGSLMVIGRSVNGWIEDWPARELRRADIVDDVIATMRRDAERADRCRMLWVTDLAGKTAQSYNTNRSAFWRVLRSITLERAQPDPAVWPSSLAWTNLYKVAPAAGWNPGADLQRAQRTSAIELLRTEIETWRPKAILAMTGQSWMAPFAASLGLELNWRDGLVEGVGRLGDTSVVVARHPMGKPHGRFVAEVLEALSGE